MALVNGRSIANALKTFFKENGRYPNLEEFRSMVTGKMTKRKAVTNEAQEENKAS